MGTWRAVKTGPDSSRGARFLYLGDAQTGLERWGRLLKAAYRRHPDIDFILLAGDLVDRGNERTNWDHFFLRADGVFDRVPLMPCVGNHEYLDMGPRLYRAFFELPRNGPHGIDPDLVYRLSAATRASRCSTARWPSPSPAAAQRQAEWLDATFRKQHGRMEDRDVSSPGLSVASLARHTGLARALGAHLRQAPRRPRLARTRPRLSEDVPDARKSPGRRGPGRERST